MIGPFDCCTTARSGESGGATAGDWVTVSACFCWEHPASNVPADAARAAYPNFLRVRTCGALFLPGAGAHVPHPPELQLPHVLPDEPITLSIFSIALSS